MVLKSLKFQHLPTTMMSWAAKKCNYFENAVVPRVLGFHPLAFLHSWMIFSQNLAYSTLFPTIPKIPHNSLLFSAKLAKKWLIFATRKPRARPGQSRKELLMKEHYGNFQFFSSFSRVTILASWFVMVFLSASISLP